MAGHSPLHREGGLDLAGKNIYKNQFHVTHLSHTEPLLLLQVEDRREADIPWAARHPPASLWSVQR